MYRVCLGMCCFQEIATALHTIPYLSLSVT